MDKIKHILFYIFVLSPLFFFCGLSVIIIDNMYIRNCQFICRRFRKVRKEIDKNKFDQMMRRLTK